MGKLASFFIAILTVVSFSSTVLAQDDASAATLYNQALEKLKAKDYQAALPLLVQAVEAADPDNETDAKVIQLAQKNGTVAGYKAGTAYRKADKFQEALEAYNAGIEFNPNFYANYIGRAQALEDLGQKADAVKAYLKAGEVSAKSKKADKAEQMERKAENMVAVSFGDKSWDETIAMANSFLEMKETADVHLYLAHGLKETGDAAKAVEHAQKAVDMASGDKGKYLMVLGESYEDLGQVSDAITAYKQITSGKYAERAEYKVNELSGGR